LETVEEEEEEEERIMVLIMSIIMLIIKASKLEALLVLIHFMEICLEQLMVAGLVGN